MAIETVLRRKGLSMKLDVGVVNGKQTFKTKSFTSVNQAATDASMYSTAVALAGLQELDLNAVNKNDASEIKQGI